MALDLTDYTSSGNDLTNNGVTEEVTIVPAGLSGATNSAKFVASETDYLSNTSPSNVAFSTTFTIEWWMYVASWGQNMWLFANNDADRQYLFWLQNSVERLRCQVHDSSGANDVYYQHATNTIASGEWHHWAVTVDTNNASATTFEFFKDGSSIGNGSAQSTSDIATMDNATPEIWIGSDSGSVAPFDGYLKDIRYWSDVRTEAEISANYQSFLAGNETGLVAYYPFESLNSAPNTPSVTAPSDTATDVAINPDATSSAFSDPDGGDTHKASQWLLSDDSGFTSTEWDSGVDTTNKTSITIDSTDGTFSGALAGETALANNTTYYLKVRHQDNNDAWSDYSTVISFTTLTDTAPNTPSITAPADASTAISINPTITSSAFSDDDAGATHQASQWLISDDAGFASTEWDSGTDTTNKTSIVVNSSNGTFGGTLSGATKLANETQYWVKVRHQDEIGNWSSYSTAISFTTTSGSLKGGGGAPPGPSKPRKIPEKPVRSVPKTTSISKKKGSFSRHTMGLVDD